MAVRLIWAAIREEFYGFEVTRMYKNVLIFAGGGFLGGLIGYLTTKSAYEKANERDIEDYKRYFQEKIDELEAKLKEARTNETMAKLRIDPEKPVETLEEVKKEENEELRAKDQSEPRDYHSYFGNIEDEEVGPEDDIAEDDDAESVDEDFRAGERASLDMKLGNIKLIRADEFGDDCRFEPKTLFYYAGDDVLATEEDEEITDISRTVGNALDKYGFRTNGERVIYVRNPNFSTDYEIQKVDGFFSEQRE